MLPAHLSALARTIYGEARGESTDGKIAVGHVILNRLYQAKKNQSRAKQFGTNVEEVCFKKWQFSCWNPNDPNSEIILNVTEANDMFKICIEIADKVLGGATSDLTIGATHYHVASMGFPKAWGEKKEPCAKIGNHWFYNNIA